MRVYHGTNSLFERVDMSKSKDKRDFGKTADTEKRISADGAEVSVLPAWKFMLCESVSA
jgi:hypothetical protein